MQILRQWAAKWNIGDAALNDLLAIIGLDAELKPLARMAENEAGVLQRERLEMSRRGGRLWRNNVGAAQDKTGRWVRYGLANESAKQNENIKSADLIGIRPITIKPPMVGQIFGQFVALECKDPAWHWTGTAREKAQLRFLLLVGILGGEGRFVQ